MTYGAFLIIFVAIPIGLLVWRTSGSGSRSWMLLAGLAILALAYTALWDNYLVANRIWWYSPSQVSGVRIGWVPIEEYFFFVFQPLLTGLWTLLLLRRLPQTSVFVQRRSGVRWGALAATAIAWVLTGITLASGEPSTRYLALILIWALPPLAIQFAYGADILWQQRRLVLLALLPATLYLGAADTVAIANGIWTINPETSLPILLGGILPPEELLFFFVTNCLIVFTVVLVANRSTVTNTDPALTPSRT